MKQALRLTIILLLFTIPGVAQRNLRKSVPVPKAEKIIEIQYTCNTELDMGIARFVNVFRKKPSAKAYVIVYANPKIAEYADALIRNTIWMFEERKIAQSRIIVIDGGFREDTTAEFFIVPKGATPPLPTPNSNRTAFTSKL